jgi:tetratricopeptide (TPR) repeat protein
MSQAEQPNSQPTDSPEAGSEEVQPFTFTLPDDPNSGKDWYLWAAVLALIALVAFWPAINGSFLWDDDQYVTQNKALQDSTGLKEIWKIPPGTIQYYPLTFTAFWVEHQFWGNNSLGYRVINLLLHAGAAIVLWRILRRLEIPGAWAAAAIWAVHPLQAESVCWISECKNVLSGVLALGSVLFYLEFAGIRDPDAKNRAWNLTEDWQAYAISAGFFVLAALAKTVVVLVPGVILVLLWWKKKLTMPRFLGTLPMLFVGAALAWETSSLETDPNGLIGASGPEWQLNFLQRLLISGRDFWFYIGKLLLPINQSFIYPRVVPSPIGGEWVFVIAAIALIVLLALGVRQLGRGPLAAVVCYLLLLFPALGFFNAYPFRFSFVADHFQYLAGIPLIVLFVGVVAAFLKPVWKSDRPSAAMTVIVSLLLIVLGAASWVRADIFADQSTLWKDVLKENKNPQSWLAAYNLAKLEQGQASATFDDAAGALQNGDMDSSKQDAQDAIALLDSSDQLLESVVTNPAAPADVLYKAHDQWAQNDVTRLRTPDTDAAKALGHASVQTDKALSYAAAQHDPLPYYTQGIVFLNRAQRLQKSLGATTQKSTVEFTATTQPYSADEQEVIDAYSKARESFQKALQLAAAGMKLPTIEPEAARVFPLTAYQSGNIDWNQAAMSHAHADATTEHKHSMDAVADFALAVRLNPTSEDYRYRLALALENVGDLNDAKQQLIVILRDLNHYSADAYNEIGRVILESKPTDMADFEAAVQSFKDAIRLNPNLIGAQKNLELANKMLASARPTTRSTTGPTKETTTAP